MGIYINPRDAGAHKIAYMRSKFPTVSREEFRAHTPGEGNKVGVVAVANGPFDALGVAFDKGEVEVFSDPKDPRHSFFFIVPLDALQELDRIAHANTVAALSK